MKHHIPKKLQGLFWSADVNNLDLDKHGQYIIHQTLRYGTLEELKWLFNTYTKDKIKNVFLKRPSKNYTPSAFHFAKHIFLNISQGVQPEDYVRTFPRRIGS